MSLRTALALLIAAPVRPAQPVSSRAATRLTTLAPLGGLLLGLVTGVVVVTVRVWAKLPGGQPQSLLPAAVGLGLLALATSARHLTGVAAVADDLATGRTGRAAAGRAADGDGRGSGPGGAGTAALVFVVLIQVCALSTAILAHRGTVSILVACLASRLAVTLAGMHRPGTAEAPGPASAVLGRRVVVGRVSAAGAALATVLSFALAAIAGLLDYDGGDPSRALRAVVALALATAAGLLMRRFLAGRFGGVSQPVLGAVVELTVTVALVTMACTVPHLIQAAVGG